MPKHPALRVLDSEGRIRRGIVSRYLGKTDPCPRCGLPLALLTDEETIVCVRCIASGGPS